MVARGAAAPAGGAGRGSSPEASTVTARARRGRRVAGGAGVARGRRPVLLAAARGRWPSSSLTPAMSAKRPTSAEATGVADDPDVGQRPNGVALAGGDRVGHEQRPAGRRALRRADGPQAGRDAGRPRRHQHRRPSGDGVWVAVKTSREVVRIDATGQDHGPRAPGGRRRRASPSASVRCGSRVSRAGRRGPAAALRPRRPRASSHGRSRTASSGSPPARRSVGRRDATCPTSLRIDPRTRHGRAVGDARRRRSAISPTAAATCGRRSTRADSIARVDPARRHRGSRRRSATARCRSVAAGGRLYVTATPTTRSRSSIRRRVQQVGRPLAVPPNPYAIAADARWLWVTGVGEDTLDADRRTADHSSSASPRVASAARFWFCGRSSSPNSSNSEVSVPLTVADREHELVGDLLVGGRRGVARAAQRAAERGEHAPLRGGQLDRGRALAGGRGRRRSSGSRPRRRRSRVSPTEIASPSRRRRRPRTRSPLTNVPLCEMPSSHTTQSPPMRTSSACTRETWPSQGSASRCRRAGRSSARSRPAAVDERLLAVAVAVEQERRPRAARWRDSPAWPDPNPAGTAGGTRPMVGRRSPPRGATVATFDALGATAPAAGR